MTINTQSAKAKGRRLQQHVANLIRDKYGASTRDVKSTSMGASGSDIQMADWVWQRLGRVEIECKSQQRIPKLLWEILDQHKQPDRTIGVVKRNYKRPLAVLDLELLFELIDNSG
jgi:hypothetical protein